MAIDADALGNLLRERLCEEVRVEQRPDGALMLRTHFAFPDGDRYPIHLSESTSGGLRLSDRGHTFMHISYDHDVDSFMDGTRGMILERIMGETGLRWDDGSGALYVDTAPDRLPEAVFAFGQALTRVYDLTLVSRSDAGSTFHDDLASLLFSQVDATRIQSGYEPDVPNARAYPVDYRIEGESGVQLFLYGIPNRDKARFATMALSHFHRHGLRFESILVFEDQAKIPRLDLARLSDVGGAMVSSLASREHFNRKLMQRIAA